MTLPTPAQRHLGHPKEIIKGSFGPHKGKMVCRKCNGAFVKWVNPNSMTIDHIPQTQIYTPDSLLRLMRSKQSIQD